MAPMALISRVISVSTFLVVQVQGLIIESISAIEMTTIEKDKPMKTKET